MRKSPGRVEPKGPIAVADSKVDSAEGLEEERGALWVSVAARVISDKTQRAEPTVKGGIGQADSKVARQKAMLDGTTRGPVVQDPQVA